MASVYTGNSFGVQSELQLAVVQQESYTW